MSNKKVEALMRRVVRADAIEQSKNFMKRSQELNETPIPEESLLWFRKTIDSRKMKKREHSIYNIFRDREEK